AGRHGPASGRRAVDGLRVGTPSRPQARVGSAALRPGGPAAVAPPAARAPLPRAALDRLTWTSWNGPRPGARPENLWPVPGRLEASLIGWPRRFRPIGIEDEGVSGGRADRALCRDRHRQGRGGRLRAHSGAGGRGRRKQTRTFATFIGALEEMADWFTDQGVT